MVFLSLLSCTTDKNSDSAEQINALSYPNDPLYEDISSSIQAEMQDLGAQNGAWAIFNSEQIIHTSAFGSFSDGTPLTPDALFRIGSLSKSMTSLAVLQQVDAGGYELNDRFSALFPDLNMTLSPDAFQQLRVADLLTHQGAVVDYTEIEGPTEPEELSSFVEGTMAEQLFLIAPPGVFWNYANPNFYLAGYLAEQQSGTLYHELMQEKIFQPLGMSSTVVQSKQAHSAGSWASGISQGEIITPESYDNSWAAPAGFIWSSVMDISLWGQFLLNGNSEILSDNLRQEMLSPIVSTRAIGSLQSYGYGMFSAQGLFGAEGYHPLSWSYHGGDIPGYTTDLFLLPEHNLGFVFLAGADYAHLSSSLIELLTQLELLGSPQETPEAWLPLSELSSYTGTYFDSWNVGEIAIQDSGTHLTVSMPRLDEYAVSYDPVWQPYARDSFITTIDGNNIVIGFVEENGVMQYVTHRAFVAHRSGEAPPSFPQPPNLSLFKKATRQPAYLQPKRK